MVEVNYFAVIASALMAMVLGFLWFGPLFGKQWIASMGWTDADIQAAKSKSMTRGYLIQAVGALLMAFVMAHSMEFAMAYLGSTGVSAGLMGGFWNWVGFIAPVTLGYVIWDNKTWGYWFITAGYYLVLLCAMGIVFALWR